MMTGYVKCFDFSQTISFFKVVEKGLLKRYIKTEERINKLIGKEFDSKPFYGDNNVKYVKAKLN